MTLLELITRLRRDLDDFGGGEAVWELDDSQCLWSNEELTSYLNEAEQEFCRRKPIRDSSTAAVCSLVFSAGSTSINLDPRILYIRRAKISGEDYPLSPTSLKDLDIDLPGWDDLDQDTPTHYLADAGSMTLRLVPAPSAEGTLSLVVDRMPLADMAWASRDTVSPEIWSYDHLSLLSWARYLAYTKPDGETLNREQAAIHAAAFEAMVGPRLSTKTQGLVAAHADQPHRTRGYYR